MSAFWLEYGLFAAKSVTVLLVVGLLLGRLFALAARNRLPGKERIAIRRLNQKFQQMARALQHEMLPAAAWKAKRKADEEEEKALHKQGSSKRRVFVLDFVGDIKASAVASLREEVTAILTIATPADEVVLRLESSGGMVHSYGLAASQLQRLRERGIPLTVTVDKVAASGGYMMACVANKVFAAPFAVVGSIGVVAQVPNFYRLLKSHNVDVEMVTAGEWKRTLTLFGENTDRARAKFQADLDDTHALFKDFVASQRPSVDIDKVATGEHWYGAQALGLGLVDRLVTSDDVLLEAAKDADLFEIHYTPKRSIGGRLSGMVAVLVERMWQGAAQREQEARLL